MNDLVYITSNKNKIEAAQKLLCDFNVLNFAYDVPEIQSFDPKEIIKYKLDFAYQKHGNPCFVTDDSLFIEAFNEFPGPFIKFFYESIGPEKICAVANLFNQHKIKSVSVLGYYDGKDYNFFEDSVKGSIPEHPRGSNGFSWDPIFIPTGSMNTYAEMSFEEKHSYTVTGKVLNKLSNYLKLSIKNS
jgi:non-canonical purine NTP pyrophosphatase (RdgB/HAM1 family)